MVQSSSSKKRVALYLRVSTNEQSTEIQRNDLVAYVTARGWQVQDAYEDHGVSGTHSNRPALKRLLNDVRERKVDIVICWKLDRFFRSLKDLVVTLHEMSEIGVEFISLRDHIDMTTASGRLMVHLLAAVSEFEASLIKMRVTAGLANAKRKGIKLGRPKQRNDEDILRLRREGQTIRAIAATLRISKGSVQNALNTSR